MRGIHYLCDLYGCSSLIDDEVGLAALVQASVIAAQATPIGDRVTSYPGHGVTVIVFAAESHVLLTTWPEYRLALVDIFLCGGQSSPEAAAEYIVSRLAPDGSVVRRTIERHNAPSCEDEPPGAAS
jgi:S-adenosylmethionine decarboxylase